ncbi:MAG: helix-turn-helix transcriptional regulator [Bacteroidales bacterium]|nr:helix-turn-helix transcriptional regulator [Bacteroidales bacterium]
MTLSLFVSAALALISIAVAAAVIRHLRNASRKETQKEQSAPKQTRGEATRNPSGSDRRYHVPEDDGGLGHDVILKEVTTQYANARDRNRDELLMRFKQYMDEKKPFLYDKVSIIKVAEELGTNKTMLSMIVNSEFHMNFRQLMNWYRIREAIQLFEADNSIPLDQLRIRSGFKSPSSFNTAFFRFTGKTPGEYCKLHAK